jgi:hypothetical protein
MPDQETTQRALADKEEGKAESTQAGEFVREEIHHIREGKHGARSAKQAIAIGLSKARRAGVKLRVPKKGTASAETRRRAARDVATGRRRKHKPSAARSRAASAKLRGEGRAAARSAAARRASRTKGPAARSAASRKAARTRSRRR